MKTKSTGTKKILAAIITLAILAATFMSVNAIEPIPMPTAPVIPQNSEFTWLEGKITGMQDYIGTDGNPVEGKKILMIENSERSFMAIIDNDTYAITFGKTNRKAMSIGDSIKVFVDVYAPTPAIYIPQYYAEFIALNFAEDKFITIARFDENFVDPNNTLKLNIGDKTEIIYQDGKKFEGETKDLIGRKLVAIYSVTTRSIPAQTTPNQIIIMYEKAVHPIYTFTDEDLLTMNIIPMPMPTAPVINQQSPEYAYVEGTIKEIKDFIGADGKPVDGKKILSIEKGENKFTAIINSDTYSITYGKVNRKAMSVGDSIRVFYNTKAPALMIYPPQYNAEFIALNLAEDKFITIDRFDKNFTDPNNNLKLNIADKTEIIYEDGKKFEGDIKDLINRKLVVIYSVTTRSIPAQATPDQIIIMYEKIVAPIYKLTEEEKATLNKNLETSDIIFNGLALDAPSAYVNEKGTLMLPLRLIAEGLGFEMNWINATKTVQMGRSLEFEIGKDEYRFSGHDPISLGTAPVLKDNRTYVPVDLFEKMPFGKVLVSYYTTEGALNIEIHMPAIGG
jgi:hypothetical protein